MERSERRRYLDKLGTIVGELGRLQDYADALYKIISDREEDEVRAEARAWAREVLADPDTVILDSETTGLPPAEVDFLEVAVINTRGEALFARRVRPAPAPKLDGKQAYPNDPIEISEGAFAVHGISAEDLEGEPTFAEVYPELRDMLKDRRVIVYNSGYDLGVLRGVVKRYGLEMPGAKS